MHIFDGTPKNVNLRAAPRRCLSARQRESVLNQRYDEGCVRLMYATT